jgi:hypothetical protein
MWPFANKQAVVELPENLRLSLTKDRGVSSDAGLLLRMVEERGNYAGRKVTYFRVFDPGNAKWGTSEPKRFNDLNVNRVIHSGHVERDGAIVLNRDSD